MGGDLPGEERKRGREPQQSLGPKGNKYIGRVLTEAAQAAVKAKGSHFQAVFRRFLPRLEYNGAIWAVAHRLCRLVWKILHDGVRYIEQGAYRDPKARKHFQQRVP